MTSIEHSEGSSKQLRRGALLALVILLLLQAFPNTSGGAIIPAVPQAHAQTESVCEATETNTYPDPAGAISTLRRQPFAGTTPGAPVVSYNPLDRTIVLSGGQTTLPGLKAALTTAYTGTDTLLTQQASGVWLLHKNLRIMREAALSISPATDGSWLRIESTAAITPALHVTNYGYLQFSNSKVTSWDTTKNTIDDVYADGRAYMVTFEGGRTDFYSTEIAFLGYKDGEASGIAWRKCFNNADHNTGATGDIHDSNIHNNFFGMYSYQAFAIWAKNNNMHDNVLYGFDPHDYSDYFIFENNTVTNNGKHGIIFSRWCDYNIIRNNTVTNSFHHGIMLDRRSNYNQIIGNTSKNNEDGIAIFQSQNNIIKGNTVVDNLTGIRINATPVPVVDGIIDRTPDQKSLYNQIIENTISNNKNYGIYLYNRSDNTTIRKNTITNNGRHDDDANLALGSGVHIKTGANTIDQNTLTNNGQGVSLLSVDGNSDPVGGGDDPDQQPTVVLPPGYEPGLAAGSANVVTANTITGSKGRGVRMSWANGNTIKSNEIASSKNEGIYSDSGSNNLFDSNNIHDNGAPSGQVSEGAADLGSYGVNIKGVDARGNKLTKNLITRSGRSAIKLGSGTNNNIEAPTLTQPDSTTVSGVARPNVTIEVFSDPADEAAKYVGTTTSDASGNWTLSVPAQSGVRYAATQTDANNNTSELSASITGFTVQIGIGRKNEPTIYVSGADTKVNLAQIQTELIKQGRGELLTNAMVDGKSTWTLGMSLFISPTVTLKVQGSANLPAAQRVEWLRIFSNAGHAPTTNEPYFDYNTFGSIKTYRGNLLFENTRVTSWDTAKNTLDTDYHDCRAYVLAKYDADLTIINSDMSYLGCPDGESYGLAWRDVNSTSDDASAPRQTRVTGQVVNSVMSNNYYGIYTFQARDMVFRGNKFHDNIQYGFDPHDFTHDVIVEDNESYNNGSHGFIISRGCTNFVFRHNISRDNKVKQGSKNPSAHGFMLDPGADPIKAGVPQVPSTYNLIEENEAYGNDGYAVRIYGSDNNVIRNNKFYNNRAGITLEKGSTGNIIESNSITGSTGEPVVDAVTGQTTTKGGYGVYAFQGADGNTINSNTISSNINSGIYVKTGNNTVQGNTITQNTGDGIGTLLETSSELPPDPPELSAVTGAETFVAGAYLNDQDPGTWSISAITQPQNNKIVNNTVRANTDSGISLKGASGTLLEGNVIQQNGEDGIYIADGSLDTIVRNNTVSVNGGYGIKANGATVRHATITINSVMTNGSGGIGVTGNANEGIVAPRLTLNKDGTVTGSTVPNAIIEIFSDAGKQGAFYEATVQADSAGAFTFVPTRSYRGGFINTTATDANGNTSSFSNSVAGPNARYVVFMPIVTRR